MSTARNS